MSDARPVPSITLAAAERAIRAATGHAGGLDLALAVPARPPDGR